jgi:hypothetical protein
MPAIDMNKRLVDSYLELFKNLSPKSKLDLISGLSASLKAAKKPSGSLRNLFDEFIPEKSAEQVTEELKKARLFTRTTESF